MPGAYLHAVLGPNPCMSYGCGISSSTSLTVLYLGREKYVLKSLGYVLEITVLHPHRLTWSQHDMLLPPARRNCSGLLYFDWLWRFWAYFDTPAHGCAPVLHPGHNCLACMCWHHGARVSNMQFCMCRVSWYGAVPSLSDAMSPVIEQSQGMSL
jgi:hypothetical protein